MKLGLYTFVALAFILVVGAFVYTLELGLYRLDIINITLPVTIWVVLPAFILYLFTVAHMLFYGFRNYLTQKKWQKDTETLEDALYWSLVNEPKEQKYGIKEVSNVASLLGKSSLAVSDSVEGLSPRLSRVLNLITKIKKGEYIDLKEEKMAKVFNEGNPILIQNRLNQLENDEKFVEEVMKSSSNYSEPVQKEALEIFARTQDFEKARKYTKVFDAKNLLTMLNRVTAEDNLNLNKDVLNEFVTDVKLTCADFIEIAQITKKYFKPDENLALFHAYQKNNEKAENAYLYLLFEYELIDQAGIFLDEQEDNEFLKFRALYDLKRKNSKYKLEDIIDIHSVCNGNKFL